MGNPWGVNLPMSTVLIRNRHSFNFTGGGGVIATFCKVKCHIQNQLTEGKIMELTSDSVSTLTSSRVAIVRKK